MKLILAIALTTLTACSSAPAAPETETECAIAGDFEDDGTLWVSAEVVKQGTSGPCRGEIKFEPAEEEPPSEEAPAEETTEESAES